MRKRDRSRISIPPSLTMESVNVVRREIESLLLQEDDERQQRRPSLDLSILEAGDIHTRLDQLFLSKCAYCENKIFAREVARIEHFRPPAAAEDRASRRTDTHHYAWLAYDWSNLYLSCSNCARLKRNSFPVRGRRAPFLTSIDEVRELEQAYLVDPCFDNPSQHLSFSWNGKCVGLTDRGKMTSAVCSLNRPTLVKSRREAFLGLLSSLETWFGDESQTAFQQQSESSEFIGAVVNRTVDVLNDLAELQGREFRRTTSLSVIASHLGSLKSEIRAADVSTIIKRARDAADIPPSPEPYDSPEWLPADQILEPDFTKRKDPPKELAPKSISIGGFKAIESLELSLPENSGATSCLMLLGENATGKSSILEAIALTLIGSEGAARLVKAPSTLLHRRGADYKLYAVEPARILIEFYGEEDPVSLAVNPLTLRFEGPKKPSAVVLAYGPHRFFVNGLTTKSDAAYQKVRSLFDARAVIPDPTEWLDSLGESDFFAVARALREILALSSSDNLVRDHERGICVKSRDRLVPLRQASEGYRSILAVSVDIMRELLSYWDNLERARAIVLIDEIETHLHPRWKMRILTGLRKAMPNVTFIATTHDPLCLRGLEDGEAIVLRTDEQQRVHQLHDLPSIKGMRTDQILTSDYFGLSSTADPEIEAKLAVYVARQRPAGGLTAENIEDAAQIGRLRDELSHTIVSADTAAGMVIEEALKIYLEERRSAPAERVSQARGRAVSAVLDALRSIPKS